MLLLIHKHVPPTKWISLNASPHTTVLGRDPFKDRIRLPKHKSTSQKPLLAKGCTASHKKRFWDHFQNWFSREKCKFPKHKITSLISFVLSNSLSPRNTHSRNGFKFISVDLPETNTLEIVASLRQRNKGDEDTRLNLSNPFFRLIFFFFLQEHCRLCPAAHGLRCSFSTQKPF